LQLVMPVFPDRRMFRIHDPEVHPDSPGGPLPPVGVLISATREQLWVGSLQQDIDVRLVLEEWDGQPLLPDSWDEEGKARLYLRGQLSIDMGAAGTAVSRLRLSGGVGNYEVRVYARYRETVVQMYEELFNQHKDPLSDEFQREKRKLEGVERYLVQLWRDSLSGCAVLTWLRGSYLAARFLTWPRGARPAGARRSMPRPAALSSSAPRRYLATLTCYARRTCSGKRRPRSPPSPRGTPVAGCAARTC
jgi:hypothetical protein